MTAHWGIEDPAGFEGPEEAQRRLFYRVYMGLDNRIKLFSRACLSTLSIHSRFSAALMRSGA